ncbi:galactose oxidase-like domain-containing protein [Pseudonocardia lutea]|uniref:Galactose oxidase-like domain-containing protein n=1 Tax=Pseudonocardia lutea TaxID=2172015 RepID=A0ABW1I8A8_9PSEU
MDTDFTAVPDWFAGASAGAGVAVGDLARDGGRSLVVLMVDAPPGANAGWYRVGHGFDDEGRVSGPWGPWQPVPDWGFWENQGAGIALADVGGTGALDLVVFAVDAPAGPNGGFYRIGRDLDADGVVTGGWTGWTPVPDWPSWENAGADIAVADVDGDGRLDLVVLCVDAPEGQNRGLYRSGPLGPDGVVTGWRGWAEVPAWWGWENQGAGVAVADLDGDGRPELVVLAVDNPAGENVGYVGVGWRLEEGRSVDGWGPWERLPGWRFWENSDAALAVVPVGAAGMPHLVTLAADAPVGGSSGWYRVLDPRTDRDTGAERGVWRLLERDSGVLAVHAALLHTGSVAFFAGSSNDPDNAAAGRFGTAVWHYPSTAISRPATPIDLFCCGHAFLPDGRLLAAGGTERYDPFLGLRQAVVFEPDEGPPDPGSPTGTTGAWEAVPDMAGGRWYPTLVTLADGRVLAVSGLDGTSQLNTHPETYRDGAGWTTSANSPNWPMYAHLFLLEDGRVFYSGGQYGPNNGERPAVWDLATNATVPVAGLPVPQARNQAASVLLPPVQDQRVMIVGGGPWDMHDMTGATGSAAIVDLKAVAPRYVATASLAVPRMHLCATLLPDRTVLVNGGAMMEESAAHAALDAEIFDPASGTWARGATSRVPRLYHSVALLMPDGRVVTAGSNPARKTEELRIEVYWPPYLFRGTPPGCLPTETDVAFGGTVDVATGDPGAIASAALLRPGATTHSADVEQRLVDLPVVARGTVRLTVRLPERRHAPPGWYLLFLLSDAGLPSRGEWVRLG